VTKTSNKVTYFISVLWILAFQFSDKFVMSSSFVWKKN